MRIAVDAMGTDARPVPDVAGAVLAARETGDHMLLVGDETRIRAELAKHPSEGLKLEVIPAREEVLMTDKPSQVLKNKPESSLHVGINLVKNGQADAFVTMGNTGATHAIATLGILRRIPGVKRPALAIIYPVSGRPVAFLDMGANADSKADWLEQFAIMGSLYAEIELQNHSPRVATLSNGEEEGKGNQLVREAQERIAGTGLNYIGHIEPKEILQAKADVVVFDGFLGNVFLKTFEATLSYFGGIVRQELTAGNVLAKLGALLVRPAFQRVRHRIDPDEFGGALLLGVNGVVVIGHGSGSARAVASAIKQARRAVEGNTVRRIRERLATLTPHAADNDD
ncbi:MAG: phosphate acyltransferase PlsX [Anaerolineae bacterium]|nr:phosphate acyltransferase PlsX [Anaerolineae bacterium]